MTAGTLAFKIVVFALQVSGRSVALSGAGHHDWREVAKGKARQRGMALGRRRAGKRATRRHVIGAKRARQTRCGPPSRTELRRHRLHLRCSSSTIMSLLLPRALRSPALQQSARLGLRSFVGIARDGTQPGAPRGWTPTPFVTETVVCVRLQHLWMEAD